MPTLDIFLADPIVATGPPLPAFDTKRMRFVYRIHLGEHAPDAALLEEAFRIFNIAHPVDYGQRSLSVGDVVTIDQQRSYRCDWIGWEQLSCVLRRRRRLHDAIGWMERSCSPLYRRTVCRLRGCAVGNVPACTRCTASLYDPEFLMPSPIVQLCFAIAAQARTFRHKLVHRCVVCSGLVWFSGEECCSNACYKRWIPF